MANRLPAAAGTDRRLDNRMKESRPLAIVVVQVIALSFAPVVCEAQPQPLRAGDLVRLTSPVLASSGAVEVAAVDPDTLRLATKRNASSLAVPWSSVTALSVRQPRTRRQGILHGAKWGLVWGTVLGTISLATPAPEGEEIDEAALALDAVFSGAAVGAAIGAIRPGKRWQRVSVAEARESVRMAASRPVAQSIRADSGETTRSTRAGMTPAVELTAAFSAPRSIYAQFPGLGVALAINAGWRATQGLALVVDAHGALFASGIMGGPRLYVRSAPLFSRRHVMTYFAQLLAGSLRAERSGVVESTGGRALQPGGGFEYGSRSIGYRLQIDQTIVRDGFIYDDRVPGQPVERVSGTRVLVGITLRSVGWRER